MSSFLRKLDDPSIDEKKINSIDYFELVYLRHRYFRKSANPDPRRLAEFEEMICNISDNIYYRNVIIFKNVGFESDDLRNIGRVNTVSFIHMSGLKENPNLMKAFIEDHKSKFGQESEPSKKDIFLRECYNLSRFLKQRLHEVASFCEIKNTNIIVSKNKKIYFIGNPSKNPSDESLLMAAANLGFKRITEVQFKKLAIENNSTNKDQFLTKDGQIVRTVVRYTDNSGLRDFYDSHSNGESSLDPEDIIINRENILLAKKLSSKKL